MLVISCCIMSKFSHFSIKSYSFLHISQVCSLEFNNIVIAATKSGTCLSHMVFIVSHAEPTEFISASWTCHMHASLIFLDWSLTFGAFFSVDTHPELGIVRGPFFFLHFLLKKITIKTVKRDMSFLIAFKAKSKSTIAKNIFCWKLRVYDYVLAAWTWTVF